MAAYSSSQMSLGSLLTRPVSPCHLKQLSKRHIRTTCSSSHSAFPVFNWELTFANHQYQPFKRFVRRMKYEVIRYDEDKADSSIHGKYLKPVFLAAQKFLHPDLPPLRFEILEGSDEFEGTQDIEGIIQLNNIPGHLSPCDDSDISESDSYSSDISESNSYSKTLCFVHFVPPGQLNLAPFRETYLRSTLDGCDDLTAHLILNLKACCVEQCCRFALLTDGVEFVLVNYRYILNGGADPEQELPVFTGSISEFSVRWLLVQCIWEESKALGLQKKWPKDDILSYQGCLNDPQLLRPALSDLLTSCRAFSDFDMYTLQRDHWLWYDFFRWKLALESQAGLIQIGWTISVDVGAFLRENTLWRSPFPNYPVPDDTLAIVTRSPRPRNSQLDELLRGNSKLDFCITKVLRTGREHYSQVVAGHLAGSDQLLCVKLFDERFFPIPEYDEYLDYTEDRRIEDLNFAEDLMRREEGVYNDRMRYLQGTLIPNCYGFHRFTLPDGWPVYGLLMEYVEGIHLSKLYLATQPENFQEDLITRLRHAVRAMKFAGVEQTDWHPDQILCLPSNHTVGPLSQPDEAREETFDIVFIDFAFACQRFGEHWGCYPSTSDLGMLAAVLFLNMRVDLIKRKPELWFPAVEEEF